MPQAGLFFRAFHAAGGDVDELVVANWRGQLLSFPGGFRQDSAARAAPMVCPGPRGSPQANACLACSTALYNAIENDPRWPVALTELQALGFTMLPGGLARTAAQTLVCIEGEPCETGEGPPGEDDNRMAMARYVE